MGNISVFAENAARYDQWYEKHGEFYSAELAAIGKLMPLHKRGIEIGVGTGRFAAPLGIGFGVDPVREMLEMAAERGVEVKLGYAENLPYPDDFFDYALMATTICFLDDVDKAFAEVARVLRENAVFSVAFVDKKSRLGKKYQHREDRGFYEDAHFHSYDEVMAKMEDAGFEITESCQTLLDSGDAPFQVLPGNGEGSFVVVNGKNAAK